MTNKEIAASFNLLAKLMELKGENPFKIRSYQKAYALLRKLGTPLTEMSVEEIQSLEGVGSAISAKIQELIESGKMKTLERYKAEVPAGIQKLVVIKGLGPKKIKTAWKELGVESAAELLYACNENRLIELKGFGAKTQEEVRKQLLFHLKHQDNFLFAAVKDIAEELLRQLRIAFMETRIEFAGDFRRKMPVLGSVEILMEKNGVDLNAAGVKDLDIQRTSPGVWEGTYKETLPVRIGLTDGIFELDWFIATGPRAFVESAKIPDETQTEQAIFQHLGLPVMPAETRDLLALNYAPPSPDLLVTETDVKGVIHTHSTFSDGIDSVEEMANFASTLGYSYLGITDHSQVAVYANGVQTERLSLQWDEIDRLNAREDSFRVFKGIECDILNDGSLDYDDETRAGFDFVIASVHTNIKMDEDKATQRIVRAIEHPHTNILGHPTGRLLLGREGYPLDMMRVIDACAANQVAIELNANPYRLDLDWTWIRKATEKGVKISINPDAHAKEAISDIAFGVIIARKGWLEVTDCLNALGAEEFLTFCQK